MILLIALVLTVTTTAILTVCVNCMGALCTACQKLTRLVFQSERNAMFLLCLAGMITLRNHTKNLAKHIFFGAFITSLAQELFMSSWKSPERGSKMLRIKCWRMKILHADALASKLANGDIKCFWKKVKKYNSGNVANSNRIENETESQNITNMWHDHYKHLFNSVNDKDDKPYVLSYIRNNLDTTDAVVTVYDTICAIKELPNNTSPGYDGFISEHCKHASHRLYVLVAIVLQSMMKHGFLPQQFMTTMLVPILKNKNGDIASKSNYRPIALSTVASKILEIILVNHVEEYIVTTENQFAYKKGHSGDMCIFTLKECIRYYTVHNTPMYVCFLNASKAFDCINHWKLFKILVDRKCPAYVIKVLVYWCQEQRLCVKWDGMASDTFSVCNGIKQGGILSPELFNIYVDVLSQQLNKVMVGCCMNGKVINHLYYADDIVLLSPSTHGMQKLLNECETYASKYGIRFNENKSVALNFKGHRFNANPSAKLYLNGSLMKTAVSYTYLGHIINNNLNDNKDIERQLINFYGKSNMLLRTFG